MQDVLKGKRFTQQTFNACQGLLRLTREYGAERLEAACARALQGNARSYRTVRDILINKLDTQTAWQSDLFQMPDHDNLRGAGAYK